MDKIIKKAISGGYGASAYTNSNSYGDYEWHDDTGFHQLDYNVAVLDPLFWQSLGKACGWIDKDYPNGEMRCSNPVGRCDAVYCSYGGYKNPVDIALEFHSLNLTTSFEEAVAWLSNVVEG